MQIGCDIESSLKAIDLAKRFPGRYYASVGLHPIDAEKHNTHDLGIMLAEIESLARENPGFVVAIGECGLDNAFASTGEKERRIQKEVFAAQLDLAHRLNLPVVIHTRQADDETLAILRQSGVRRFVIHCFASDVPFATKIMETSDEAYFGFSGIVTYKSAPSVQEVASIVPENRILIETDAPFLAPQAVRGQVNESANVHYVLTKIAELRNETDIDAFSKRIVDNTNRFYNTNVDTN